jgi:serine/threonine protein kinase
MITNNISDRLNLTNDMYNYIAPVNRLKMGNVITEKIKNEGCNPRRLFYRVAGDNANFKVREIITTTPLRFKNKNGKKVKGIREIGKGAEGTVYIGCLDKECKKQLAIKHGLTKDVSFEYKITKEIHNWSPHIVTPYALSKACSGKKSYYYSEYQSGGDLLKWIGKNHIHLKPLQIKVIVFQVLYTIFRIQQMDPTFRHNDLHGGNMFH